MKPAAVEGYFANYKLLSGRGVLAITVEFPISEQETVLTTLGFPTGPAGSGAIPVAVARMNPDNTQDWSEIEPVQLPPAPQQNINYEEVRGALKPKPERSPAVRQSSEPPPDPPQRLNLRTGEYEDATKPVPRFDPPPKPERSPAVRDSALVCKEPEFWRFLQQDFRKDASFVDSEEKAAWWLRRYCAVESRADIKPGSNAEHRFNQLFLRYGSWRRRQKASANG